MSFVGRQSINAAPTRASRGAASAACNQPEYTRMATERPTRFHCRSQHHATEVNFEMISATTKVDVDNTSNYITMHGPRKQAIASFNASRSGLVYCV
jgi:hypothetical protein